MTFNVRVAALFVSSLLVCCLLYVFAGQIDLGISSRFYDGDEFAWRVAALPNFFHDLVHPVSVTLVVLFAGMAIYHYYKRSAWRRWVFLLLTLIVGPGLLTNTLLKDNWDRARPLQVTQFGGPATFSPPFVRSNQCRSNCSFVSGDAAFGFWFHSFAYVAKRRRRQVFWAGLSVGAGYGLLRIGMGAHFFSDVIGAGLLILATSASLYTILFGRKALTHMWQEWLGGRRLAA